MGQDRREPSSCRPVPERRPAESLAALDPTIELAPASVAEANAVAGATPDLEWVFGCTTLLGAVAPGARDTFFNGRPVRYRPNPELGSGARWCSAAWLERDRGRRGFLASSQGAISLFCMHISGQIGSGTVVLVPDDQVEASAALASRLLTSTSQGGPVLREWSMAVVRDGGRSRLAVRLSSGDGALGIFASELDVEWFIDFGPGLTRSDDGTSGSDRCIVRTADGSHAAELRGVIYLEDEPVPSRLIEIAQRHGDGLTLVGGRSGVITIPTESHRPLEPDEWDIDSDHRRWLP